MASKTASRSLQSITRQARQRCTCATAQAAAAPPVRQFSTSTSRRQQAQSDGPPAERPRWTYTPEKMMAPFGFRVKDPAKAYRANSDPVVLDSMYTKFLGRGGSRVLSDEIKWLAVTHKSFDQGRRGFNDRLAFFGRRILNLQATLALLESPVASQTQSLESDARREPFRHPDLDGLRNITDVQLSDILTKERLSGFAAQVGLPRVVRWKPKSPDNLSASGLDGVMTTTIYAIIGAIALQKGSAVAAQVARERVLKPLGI
ncbi:54S ribosomal protein L15, mitochondrial [Phlyctema vagabunda]|uniref:54S ribosomal protein L15, mitochondrial n=1 Tax=Phlyctema vagabunda TaxID=108571 RepID=A0ABR4PIG6_9HELO